MDRDNHWVQVKLEENARSALVVTKLASIVSNAVLVRMKRCGAWRNVGSRDHMEVVLVCDERVMGKLKRVVEWLYNVGEIGPEGELGDDMRKIHLVVGNVNMT